MTALHTKAMGFSCDNKIIFNCNKLRKMDTDTVKRLKMEVNNSNMISLLEENNKEVLNSIYEYINDCVKNNETKIMILGKKRFIQTIDKRMISKPKLNQKFKILENLTNDNIHAVMIVLKNKNFNVNISALEEHYEYESIRNETVYNNRRKNLEFVDGKFYETTWNLYGRIPLIINLV